MEPNDIYLRISFVRSKKRKRRKSTDTLSNTVRKVSDNTQKNFNILRKR